MVMGVLGNPAQQGPPGTPGGFDEQDNFGGMSHAGGQARPPPKNLKGSRADSQRNFNFDVRRITA
jgi:hypothetical protein